ncbi:hypothetical protein [Comamonas terrigena]|uniref:hypothetical protein n=1 Tax=Comamonas terrigena TaxID=32013 RepID=UPI0028AC99C1|nr:hypothetical protein [Comamonas terrigena]
MSAASIAISEPPQLEANSLRLLLDCVLDGHPDVALALLQIDQMICSLKTHADTSVELQKSDPLVDCIQRIRASLN